MQFFIFALPTENKKFRLMTLLTKIRNRSGLLVTIIALALLIFILESALESSRSFSSGDRTRVGEIEGREG